MAIKLEKTVKTFYDNLEAGKITGKKCNCCGNVEFPPTYACNACGSTDLEWYEISGKAKLRSVIMPSVLANRPFLQEFGPYAFGDVELEEGTLLNGTVIGITKKNRKEVLEKLPVDVKAKIIPINGCKIVIFEMEEI
jgi:hypothetical protein